MTVHKVPIKKYNIVKRQSTSRLPLPVKAPTIVGGRLGRKKQQKKKSQRGGGDPWGRDVATKQLGDKIWDILLPLVSVTREATPNNMALLQDLIYRGSWDAATDEVRPQMGSSAAQFFSHIPIIGGPLAGISNIVSSL
jgi:hypothetical protein